jgi:hypothetical protein
MTVVKQHWLVEENSQWQAFFDHLTDRHSNEVPDFLTVEGR